MATPVAAQLIELQDLDTRLDRLGHARRNAPEHGQLDAARSDAQQAAQRRAERQARFGTIDEQIAANEKESEQLGITRDRLQAQLRTVFATREAEALMHEIDTINARRGELDDAELAALEEQEQLMSELDADESTEPQRVEAVGAAQAALDEVLADFDSQIAAASDERTSQVSDIPEALVARYERLRSKLGGVGVARLDGRQCTGCHLDLSPGELDLVRHAADDELVECPQCSRLLVR